MKQSKMIAVCGMMAALSIVVMILGAALGLGIYISPMLAGICLIPVRNAYGKKYHTLLWLVVSLLGFMLVPNVEENLMYLCLFGLYPIIRPYFQKIPKVLRFIAKLLFFTIVFTALELLVMMVLVPEPTGAVLMIALIVLGDITFMVYDFVIPYAEALLSKYLGKFIKG